MIIKEDYVSYEVAKLLKEKGFHIPSTNFRDWVFCMYDESGNIQWGCYHPDWYARVTLQMAMKWLREVHGLSIEIFSIKGTSNICPVFWKGNVVKLLTQDRAFSGELVDSYEEAVEAALKYVLEKLI